MAKFIRNCRLPTLTSNQSAGAYAFFMREAMIIAGWSENANDGDLSWTDPLNHVFVDDLASPGFAVLAVNPCQVTHSGNPFTQAQVDGGMVLALQASNDQNVIMLRITEFVDAGTVKIDHFGFPPKGWLDESAIPGRILDYGSAVHTTGAWVKMDPPSGNNRARLEINLINYVECYAQPRAGLADFTETPSSAISYFYDNYDYIPLLNAWFDGNNALFYKWADGDGTFNLAMWGELDGVATLDTFPGFVLTAPGGITIPQPNMLYQYRMDMLGAASFIPIRAWMDSINLSWVDASTLNNSDDIAGRRLINGTPGFARQRKPSVILDDVLNEGAFIRGYLPGLRQGPIGLADVAPVGAAGKYLNTYKGVTVPRNGPFDQLPITAV